VGWGGRNVRPAETGLFNLEIKGNDKEVGVRSTFSQEAVLWIRLLEIVNPSSVVRVWGMHQLFLTRDGGGGETLTCIGADVRVDICLSRELGWVACVVDRVRPLVHPDPIDRHGYRER